MDDRKPPGFRHRQATPSNDDARTVAEDTRLIEQVRYYRCRAGEYDKTAYPPGTDADRVISDILDRVRPSGRILEIACGTGAWTTHLAQCTGDLTAIDSSSEMIELARAKVPDGRVAFMVADAFDFWLEEQFDTVFFAFWLSHVPSDRFARFWSTIRAHIKADGRVLFVDERRHALWEERYVGDEVVERQLTDGSTHRLIKVMWEPVVLERELTRLGWRAEVQGVSETWMVGHTWPNIRGPQRPRCR